MLGQAMVRPPTVTFIALALASSPCLAHADGSVERNVSLPCAQLTIQLPATAVIGSDGPGSAARISFVVGTRGLMQLDIRCDASGRDPMEDREATWDDGPKLTYRLSEEAAGASGGTAVMLDGVLTIGGRSFGVGCYTQGEDYSAEDGEWCLPHVKSLRLSR